ncbi:phosphosugar-binding protein, partial [Listeria monocytogenes]|nr:phosphosugar-binding protein [Listeria monocytogenes]
FEQQKNLFKNIFMKLLDMKPISSFKTNI